MLGTWAGVPFLGHQAQTGWRVLLRFVTQVGIDCEGSLTPAQSLHSWLELAGGRVTDVEA